MATNKPKYLQEKEAFILELDAWRDQMMQSIQEMHEYAAGLANGNEDQIAGQSAYVRIPSHKTARETLDLFSRCRAQGRNIGATYRKMMARRAKKASQST